MDDGSLANCRRAEHRHRAALSGRDLWSVQGRAVAGANGTARSANQLACATGKVVPYVPPEKHQLSRRLPTHPDGFAPKCGNSSSAARRNDTTEQKSTAPFLPRLHLLSKSDERF